VAEIVLGGTWRASKPRRRRRGVRDAVGAEGEGIEVVGNGGSPSRLGGLRERRKLPQRGPGHSKKPAKYKKTKSHLISQNFSLNLCCQLASARTAKNTEPRLLQWIRIQNIPIEQPILLNQRSAVNDVNFQRTLQ